MSFVLQERFTKNNIKALWNSETNQTLDNNKFNNIEIINNITKKKKKLAFKYYLYMLNIVQILKFF